MSSKHLIYFLFFLLIGPLHSFALRANMASDSSGRFSFGVEVGLTNSRIQTEEANNAESITMPEDHLLFSTGLGFGLCTQYRMSNSLAASLGLGYLVNSIVFENPEGYYMLEDSSYVAGHSQSSLKIQRFLVPIDLRWYPFKQKSGAFAQLGYAWAKYLQTEETTTGYSDIDDQEILSASQKGKMTYYNDSHSFLRLGIGFEKSLNNHLSFGAVAVYNRALTALYDKEILFNSNHYIHFFQLGIQIRYSL